MSRKLTIVIVILVLITTAIAARVDRHSAEVLRVGAILPLSGPGQSMGEALREGYLWQLEKLEASGVPIVLTIEDGRSNPKDSVSAFNKLIEVDNVDVVFSAMSSVSLALKPLAQQQGVLLWTNAAHPDITTDSSYILRHSNTVNADTDALARHIQSSGYGSVAILNQQDDWGVAMRDALIDKLSGFGITTKTYGIDHTQSDFRTTLLEVNQGDHDALISIVFGPAAGIVVKQSGELGLSSQIYSSVGFALTANAPEIAGDAAKGTYYQAYIEEENFIAEYKKRYNNKPKPFVRITYTDLEILANAYQNVGREALLLAEYIKRLESFEGEFEKVYITMEGDIIAGTEIRTWPN